MGTFAHGLWLGSLVTGTLSFVVIYGYILMMPQEIQCRIDTNTSKAVVIAYTHMHTRRPRHDYSNVDLSIVMTYYNRPTLLMHTLDSIARCTNASQYSRIEVIIVDDGSANHTSDVTWVERVHRYPFDVYVWRIEPRDKDWFNP